MAALDHGPIDPGANLAWWSQYEQQAQGKDDDPDEDDDEDGDDDEGDDPDADKDVDTLRAELKSIRESLNRSSSSGKSRRDKIKRLESELAEARKTPAPKKDADGGDKPDLDAVRNAARSEALAEATKTRKADRAEIALIKAGLDPERLARATKTLDLDDVDLNDDGTLDGIEDAIDALKADEPQWFGKVRRRRDSTAGNADRDGDNGGGKSLTTSEAQAKRLLGR